jgi:hypothetical protein|tara:strand:+ start:135 stop:464 length:330 start_codon:yes stop_codon:yes gene_type:complete
MRPICETCGQRPRAINYRKDDRIFYRKKCEQCLKQHKPVKPLWVGSGYKVKRNCEACGFKPSIRSQVTVFYVDSDLTNVAKKNLKTVCLNCNAELVKTGWSRGDLAPDA